ncbi:4-diphosphocytidyl-2-C-methyl-D-erythritol kinase [Halalkalibacter wakoensis JCM 9140]|uniref:4-diphosphocytidyl-2-C-methyl-D-erythritol kinase n=1 Tax=Halalkalibacter wakoensis JCM 9140 TaxID=1236970 RepID=W4Q6M6_9BACI|nr:4-diphosphocytidyl-2-C-methyl-D-erythritol kinase [Halalkalibacter wakoensis JCM 9140]
MRCSVKAPAKINLSLDAIRKRDDGFHEVEMIMTMVDLADRIDLTDRDDGKIVVDVSEGFVPNDQRNLAYQAADLLKKRYHVKKGYPFILQKEYLLLLVWPVGAVMPLRH